VNPSAAQYPSPALAGTCAAAPTDTPGDTSVSDAGWAMLPHSIAADARLTAVDIRVVLALLYFARSKHTCTPCDQSIGERAGGISPGTVQRSLRRLESLGYIRRESVAPSDRNRTGRVFHLLWRAPRVPGYSHPDARRTYSRVSGGPATGERPVGRRCATPRSLARDKEDVVVEAEKSRIDTDSALRPRPVTASPVVAPEATAPTTATSAVPFDLRAIGAVPELHPKPARATPPQRHRPRLGLSLEELAKVARDTADPILAAELARRTAPPSPPEPPLRAMPTAELFAALPGRHDLIMAAARRLCEETGDFKVASLRTFEKMAEAVAVRAVPPSVLIDCWRQGMGPQAEHKGKVLVAAWKRQTPLRC
jgi:DNA-binding Lrp family transcriptional regulator